MTEFPGWAIRQLLILALGIAVAHVPAHGEGDYPNRIVKIVVPLPPGPTADVLPRILAERLAARWGQPVIVENRPGAASNLGAELVARAAPDGYTLLATPQGPLVISQSFYRKLNFDPAAFVPITVFAAQPLVLVVNPKVPASTLGELIAYARSAPDKINFASPGAGSSPHLTGEMFKLAAGVRMTHVPYTGLGPAMSDVLAGNVDAMFDNLGNSLPHIKAGKLKALAVAGDVRAHELPDVPTIAEMSPGFYASSWFALVASPGTPGTIADTIAQAVTDTLKLPDVAKRFADLGVMPVSLSPAETAEFFKKEAARWKKVIVSAGIAAE